MLDKLLAECRRRLFRDRLRQPAAHDDPLEQLLLEHGTVVWGYLVQADPRLFEPGEDDLPGLIVASSSLYFDDHYGHLLRISESEAVRWQVTVINRELAGSPKHPAIMRRLPEQATDGHAVFVAVAWFRRDCLPDGQLSDWLVPVVICPERTPAVRVLPLCHWPERLLENWGKLISRLMPDRPPLDRILTAPPSLPAAHLPVRAMAVPQERPTSLVGLTLDAAIALREQARGHLPRVEFYVRLTVTPGPGLPHYVLEVCHDEGERLAIATLSRGIKIAVNPEHVALVAGCVIGHERGPDGDTFLVHPCEGPTPGGTTDRPA